MEIANKIKYFLYARKSSEAEERQALSIPSQRDKAKELFGNLDIEVIEESKSAFSPHDRPHFMKMLERIRSGEFQGLIAWHPDRLSRNEVDAAQITYLVRTGVIKDLRFGSYNFDNSPEGIMMLQIALSQSQYFSSKLGKDVRRGLDKKADLGWRPSGAPAGYLNTPHIEKGFKIIVKDPNRFDLIRKMWDMMLSGNYTPPKILQIANKEWGYRTLKHKRIGDKPLSRSGIYKILTNPFYFGYFERPEGSGNWQKGEHDPMITKEEFDRVQILLGRKGKPAPHTREFAFTGLMQCGACGASVTAEEKNQIICTTCKHKFGYENKQSCPECDTPIERMTAPTIRHYIYYHCTKRKGKGCTQGSIKLEELEKQISEYLSTIQIKQEYLDWAIKHLRKAHEIESESRQTITSSQQNAYNHACNSLDKLLDLKLRDLITEDEYKNKKTILLKERESCQNLLEGIDHQQDKWLQLSEKTFNFARYAIHWFEEAKNKNDLQGQREILSTLGSNIILKDKKLSISAPEPFEELKKCITEIPEAFERLEPEIMLAKPRQKAPLDALRTRWLRSQDSNLEPSRYTLSIITNGVDYIFTISFRTQVFWYLVSTALPVFHRIGEKQGSHGITHQ